MKTLLRMPIIQPYIVGSHKRIKDDWFGMKCFCTANIVRGDCNILHRNTAFSSSGKELVPRKASLMLSQSGKKYQRKELGPDALEQLSLNNFLVMFPAREILPALFRVSHSMDWDAPIAACLYSAKLPLCL